MRTEADFMSAIDCRFPYEDGELAASLIEESCSISPNAAFHVLFELACRPASCTAPLDVVLRLFLKLKSEFQHPLNGVIFPIAEKMIKGEIVTFEEAKAAMMVSRKYPGTWNVLGLLENAGEHDDLDALGDLYDEIVAFWNARDSCLEPDLNAGRGDAAVKKLKPEH